jgi:hypothetical protein
MRVLRIEHDFGPTPRVWGPCTVSESSTGEFSTGCTILRIGHATASPWHTIGTRERRAVDRVLPIVTLGARDRLERRQTRRAVTGWSHTLLRIDEPTVCRRR